MDDMREWEFADGALRRKPGYERQNVIAQSVRRRQARTRAVGPRGFRAHCESCGHALRRATGWLAFIPKTVVVQKRGESRPMLKSRFFPSCPSCGRRQSWAPPGLETPGRAVGW